MKNKLFVLIILILSVFIYLPNVHAIGKNTDGKTCGERNNAGTCTSTYDVNGNTCSWSESSCNTLKVNCSIKKHCTCYNATTCPAVDDYGSSCYARPKKGDCIVKPTSSDSPGSESYNNYEENSDVTCGNGLTFNKSIANITYYMVLLFQVIAPVMLIVLGMIDLFKGFTSGKDDVIKKAQATFIKRLVVAALMFLIITIVRFVIGFFSTNTIMDCFNCFVNGAKSC